MLMNPSSPAKLFSPVNVTTLSAPKVNTTSDPATDPNAPIKSVVVVAAPLHAGPKRQTVALRHAEIGNHIQPLIGGKDEHIRARATKQHIIARIARKGVIATIAINRIIAGTAANFIIAPTGKNRIRTRAAKQPVIAKITADAVVAILAIDHIIAQATVQIIVAFTAQHGVIAVLPKNTVVIHPAKATSGLVTLTFRSFNSFMRPFV